MWEKVKAVWFNRKAPSSKRLDPATLDTARMQYFCLFGIVYPYVTHHAKRDLVGIAKSIDPGQPAQTAQADQVRTFRYWQSFLCI